MSAVIRRVDRPARAPGEGGQGVRAVLPSRTPGSRTPASRAPESRTSASRSAAPRTPAPPPGFRPGDKPAADVTRQRPRNGPNDTPRQRQRTGSGGTPGKSEPAAEPAILFQEYFKSAGPRTYAAQVKQAANGNHFLVLTEGKRDRDTDALKKCSLYLFSEDFPAFFRMLKSAAEFIKAHPVPPEVKQRRAAYWARQKKGGRQTRDSGRSATG